jgi:hypothetical protein
VPFSHILNLQQNNRTVTRYAQDLCNLLSNSSLAEKKSSIKSFVNGVRVTGDKVLLNYTIPLPPRRLTVEEMPVLPTVHYGGAGFATGIAFELAFSLTS